MMLRAECERFADLLDAEADGELPAQASADLARHLGGCAECVARLAAIRGLQAEVASLRAAPPPGLEQKIRARLPAPAAAPSSRRRVLELAAAACVGLVAGGLGAARFLAPAEAGAEHDMITAHARGLLAGLPLQVASGDPHGVRPWLSARLPAAPRVLAIEEFPLLGARLDLVAGQPVAAVLYRRREHVITVFAAGDGAAAGWPGQTVTRRGFTLIPWNADGVHYVAVSDLNRAELAEMAARLGASAGR